MITHDLPSSYNQVVEELNMKNSLLNSEKDELNKVILEQAQQLTGWQLSSHLDSS